MTSDVSAELRNELRRRAAVDQEARRALTPPFDEIDQALLDRLHEVDRENTRWLRELVERQGWPGRSLVGDDAADCAWLLAQHADQDPALQRHWLDLMRALPPTEVKAGNIAYLTDRVLLAEGESQIYGTQMTMVDGEYEPRNLRDPDTVDERRAAVGLGTMAEYVELMHSE